MESRPPQQPKPAHFMRFVSLIDPPTYKLVTLNGVVTPVAPDFKEEPRRPGVYVSGEPVSFGHRPGQGGIFMEGSDGQFREI